MSVRRVQGSEVEYGIAVTGQPHANPMVASTHVVNSYAAAHGLTRRARWDFEEENPLRDARGFDLSRDAADPSQLTDEDLGLANIILSNGARLYVDHAHPEYSSPEVTNPRDVVVWEKAGEAVMRLGAELAGRLPGAYPIVLYKNNVDNKGASYGSHENYLMARDVPFETIVEQLTPFFVSRQVITGAGRVGQRQDGSVHAFQIAQRADYMEVGVGLETTLKRPIINTRDEPHADPKKYRRLHVILGDANCSEIAIYLKHGMTSLVLAMIEAGELTDVPQLANPVQALHDISHDPTLKAVVELFDGRTITALDLQGQYLAAARRSSSGTAATSRPTTSSPAGRACSTGWPSTRITAPANWTGWPSSACWSATASATASIGTTRSCTSSICSTTTSGWRRGSTTRSSGPAGSTGSIADDEIKDAVATPPTDTRAYFRGMCLARFAPDIAAASWDSVIFDLPGHDSLQRVPTMEPLRGTKDHVGALFDRCESATELFRAITAS